MKLIKEGMQFFGEVYDRRSQVYDLTKRDFNSRYIGSFLGFLWAFVEPLALTSIIWVIFGLGLRQGGSGDVPFVAYLIPAMAAYTFFSNTIGASSNVLRTYSFLIKKVKFRVAILPIIKINSALLLHLIFLFIVAIIIWAEGIPPSIFWFQTLYYTFSLFYFLLGACWLLAAIGVFIRDISHIVSILLTFGFWVTPIFWNINMLPEKLHVYLCINPMFYIVQGYRESLIYKIPFWHHPVLTIYFWTFSTVILITGILVFKKLRPHFADVL